VVADPSEGARERREVALVEVLHEVLLDAAAVRVMGPSACSSESRMSISA